MSRRLLAVALAVLLTEALFAVASVRHVSAFSSRDLTFKKTLGRDLVTLSGASLSVRIGEPVVPVRYLRFALPIGYQATGVTATVSSWQTVPGSFHLVAGTAPIPTDQARTTKPLEGPAYRSPASYPADVTRLLGTGNKSGYSVASVAVYPLRYEPSTGKLMLASSIEVKVETAPSAIRMEVPSFRDAAAEAIVREDVKGLVCNPSDVPSSASCGVGAASGSQVTYLIVTAPGLAWSLQPLADWKTQKGVPTQIVTTDWIYATYPGEVNGDGPDKIRQCIKDYWQNHGTVFVLLGGDVEFVPCRYAFAKWGDGGETIPSDLYYADLQGTWNANCDGYWGDITVDQVDLYHEVYVGRAPIDTTDDANLFVRKVLEYEGAPGQRPLPLDFETNILYLGSMLDSGTDDGILMDTIDSESVPGYLNKTKLYQSAGTLNWTTANNALNTGPNLVAHAGHGNSWIITMGGDYYDGSACYNLINGQTAPHWIGAMYSLACDSCDFPSDDCLGECFNKAPNGGGNYIGNTRYGWYYGGWPTYEVSAQLERDFFWALFPGGATELGRVHGQAQDYFIPDSLGDDYNRYCLYEITLIGDAETPIWKHTPAPLNVSFPPAVPLGASSFTVHVESGGGPLAQARVCLWKGSEVYVVGQTDSAGNAAFSPSPATTGPMTVTVTKNDYLPSDGTADVVTSSLHGVLSLGNLTGSVEGQPITIELRTPGTTNVVGAFQTTISGGGYQVPAVWSGTFDVSTKFANWLRQTFPSVAITGSTEVDFSLANGDAWPDNLVDLLDLSTILANYLGTGTGDVDWSGRVNLVDLSTVLADFGMSGDR